MFLRFKSVHDVTYVTTENLIAIRFCLTKRGKGRQKCSIEFEFYAANTELSVRDFDFDIINDKELESIYEYLRANLTGFFEFDDFSDDDQAGEKYPDMDYYFIKLDKIISIHKWEDSASEIVLINNRSIEVSNDTAIDALIRKLTVQNI